MLRRHSPLGERGPALRSQSAARALLALALLACAPRGSEPAAASEPPGTPAVQPIAEPVAQPAADTLWLLALEPAGDAIRADDTEESLIARYGAANVTREPVDQGEGMLVPGTVIFASDTARRLEIQWDDTVGYTQPRIVTAMGHAWKVAPGIGFGTTLRQLELLNGRPFELLGFQGHYSGSVTSWGGGRLAPLDSVSESGHTRVRLALQPEPPYPPGIDTEPYSAENRYPSSDAGIQLLNPRVVWIEIHPR